MGRRALHRHSSAIAETVSSIAMASDDAGGNFWSIAGSTGMHSQAGPSGTMVAVVLVTGKQSGFYRLDVDAGWSDNTNADLVTWTVTAKFVNVAGQVFAIGGAGKTAAGFGGSTAGGGAAGFIDGVGGGTGLTITNPVGGATASGAIDTKQYDTLTGLLGHSDQYYGMHGIVAVTQAGVATPIVGKQIAFIIDLSATNTITIPSFTFGVQEVPWQ